MLSPVTLKQFERFKQRYPDATLQELPSTAALLTVPQVPVPAGWSHATSSLRFIVPQGYPGPAPDCFWADQHLTLAGGVQPRASAVNPVPETAQQGRWFSWHVVDVGNNWHPNRDDLLTYMGICLDRLRQAQ